MVTPSFSPSRISDYLTILAPLRRGGSHKAYENKN